jgi:hypothetical protein
VLRLGQARLIQLALENCRCALIGCSLNPQEVGVAVQSIWAPVQVRDVARDHFFVPSREMSFRKMNSVRELNYLAQEIGPRPEINQILAARSPRLIQLALKFTF